MLKIALIFGGKSAEHMVSIKSARTIYGGLKDAGYEVLPVAMSMLGQVYGADLSLKYLFESSIVPDSKEAVSQSFFHLITADFDVIFPIVHGAFGEDGCLQGLAALLQKPCVGTTLASSAMAMDKIICKQILAAAGLDVVESVFVDEKDMSNLCGDLDAFKAKLKNLQMPVFVKPAVGGSSAGCRKCEDWLNLEETLNFAFKFHHQVLVERAVDARELEVSVLGCKDAFQVSEIGEIKPAKEFYDYKDKYIDDKAGLEMPAQIESVVRREIQAQAIRAFAAIGGEGMARVDFFFEEAESRLMINEINTLPGFTSISMYPKLWAISGLNLSDLCQKLVETACFEFARKEQKLCAVYDFVAENKS